MRPALRGVIAAAVTAVVFGLWSAPASAHSPGDDPAATNYRTEITSVTTVAGVTWRIVEAGDRVEVRNESPQDLIVMDYNGDPYLKIGPAGVFENQRSPAIVINKSRFANTGPAPPPATGEPQWRHLGNDHVFRWHDHRTHWMSPLDPPQVVGRPDRSHVVMSNWEIPARWGDQVVAVRGNVTYQPPPALWPWLLFGGVALCIPLLAEWRRFRAAGTRAAAGITLAASVALTVGSWGEEAGPVWLRLSGIGVRALIWLLALVAWHFTTREDRRLEAAGFAAAAATGAALVGGWQQLRWLWHSQLPTALPASVARGVAATVAGVALGSLGALLIRQQREFPKFSSTLRKSADRHPQREV